MQTPAIPYKLKGYIARDKTTPASGRGFRKALYDSELKTNGYKNAELTIRLRVFFQGLDPAILKKAGLEPYFPGSYVDPKYQWGPDKYKLREFDWHKFQGFKNMAVNKAHEVWNDTLCLVPPYQFTLFDWPPDNPRVRPNLDCRLEFILCENTVYPHATVFVLSPGPSMNDKTQRPFHSVVHDAISGDRQGAWDLNEMDHAHDNWAVQDRVPQKEHIPQWMFPHETGHLLGLPHIGETLQVKSCYNRPVKPDRSQDEGDPPSCYGSEADLPMWYARDIMGMGMVVHLENIKPWTYFLRAHINGPPATGPPKP